jgi:hypothetical protein
MLFFSYALNNLKGCDAASDKLCLLILMMFIYEYCIFILCLFCSLFSLFIIYLFIHGAYKKCIGQFFGYYLCYVLKIYEGTNYCEQYIEAPTLLNLFEGPY